MKTTSLDVLRQQSDALRREIHRREQAERRPRMCALIGKCFKYRNNYSVPATPRDYWWLYRIYTRVDRGGVLHAVDVQVDKYGNVHVDNAEQGYEPRADSGWIPITRREFDRALAKALRHASAMAKKVPA